MIVSRVLLVARLIAGAVAIGRIGRAARSAVPVRPLISPAVGISVVIPARDEAQRIGPLLDAIIDAPGVTEVIVVDDQSSDGTAAIAHEAGATVLAGSEPPDGWVGKAWALQQGFAAASGDWVVTLDADTRPHPALPQAMVSRAMGEGLDLLTISGRFDCPTPGARWLHAAMLTTLVYRFGPPGVAVRPDRMMANGQCMAVPREPFLAGGAMEPVRGEVVEDVALARTIACDGGRVGFYDGADLLEVQMFDSLEDTWNGWGRSLALPGVESLTRQAGDLAVVLAAQALPLPRLLLRRGDAVDVVLAACRIGTLCGTRRAFSRVDLAYWLSPLADLAAVAALARGILRRGSQVWRGRTYG